ARLEHVSGNFLTLRDDLIGRFHQRRTPDGNGTRPIGSQPKLNLVGIAEDDLHVIEGNTELFRSDLSKRCFVPLPMIVGADEHRHVAGRMYTDGRAFEQTASSSQSNRNA